MAGDTYRPAKFDREAAKRLKMVKRVTRQLERQALRKLKQEEKEANARNPDQSE